MISNAVSTFEIEKWLNDHIGLENYTPGLLRVNQAIQLLQLKPKAKIITVAGTNGKGSVCRLLSHSLVKQYDVALFTSPHLLSITERYWYNGQQIDPTLLFDLLKKTWNTCELSNIRLTHFELLFIVFLQWLKEARVDFIILEVGLGGRLDATNALDANLTVVTSISRDHQAILGNRFEKILREKLGITRPHVPLVTAFELSFLRNLTDSYCRLNSIPHYPCSYDNNFTILNKNIVSTVFKLLSINLPISSYDSSPKQFSSQGHLVTFYGSHNPDAVRKLVHFLCEEHYNKSILAFDLLVLSFSKRSEKDLVTMVKQFLSLKPDVVKQIIITSFEHPKAEEAMVLEKIAKLNGISFVKDFKPHFHSPQKILASGSNYFYLPLHKFMGANSE